jgi:hypothetical protein
MEPWQEQDARIDELARIIPPAQFPIMGHWERYDWGPCHALMKEIGINFKGLRYPTPQERQAAWERYRALREEADSRLENERSGFRGQSEWYCEAVLAECSGISYSPVEDLLIPFDTATADKVRHWGTLLQKAIDYYGTVKHRMLREHKERCWEKFDEVRASHRHFWAQLNQARDERRAAYNERKATTIEKIRANRDRNTERLEKLQAARDRVSSHKEEIQAKLDETTSEKWQGIFQEWIDQDEQSLDDIDAKIDRIQGYIDEDEQKLGELED